MSELNLSYTEAFEVIPYRNLIMMMKDKLHSTTGDVIRKTTSADLFGDKIK
jgi:hypothetical protein